MKELNIDAKTENLDTVLDFVANELEAAECSMKLQTQIAIAVEEIFVNIAHYAYNQAAWASNSPTGERPAPEVGGAVIRVTVGDEVCIEFEDKGKSYNPLDTADPDITLGAEEREAGGLGIFMVKKIMDAVEYRREGNTNILTVRKGLII
jgi:anti-sigma regulatory factor (Ser/Thr protein kinase)